MAGKDRIINQILSIIRPLAPHPFRKLISLYKQWRFKARHTELEEEHENSFPGGETRDKEQKD